MEFLTNVFENAQWLQAIVAAISTFVVGFVWYGPLFGKQWMANVGLTPEDAKNGNMPMIFGLTFLGALLTAIYLSSMAGIGAVDGMKLAILPAIFFVFPALMMNNLYEQKPHSNIWINAGYQLVAYAVMGLIIGAWS